MQTPIVYVGMDFGSFKTSVVASNGRRETMHTVVGWAKDHVARALLGCDVLVGKHVFEQRLALNVVRPFEKGTLKYRSASDSGADLDRRKEAARLVVQEAVRQLEIPSGAMKYAVVGAPSRANGDCKKIITEVVRDSFDAVMIVAEPFAVAFGMGRLTETLVVDIGAGTTDICPVFGSYPREEDQITISLGGDTIDEMFLKAVKAKYPDVQISLNMARQIKEKHGFVHEVNELAVVSLPVNGRPTQIDVTEPLRESCKAIVGPIVEGIQEAVRRFDPEFQRPLLNNILLGGGGSCLQGLDRIIEEALVPYGGGKVSKAYDSVFAGADGALKLAMNVPENHWQQLTSLSAADQKREKAAA